MVRKTSISTIGGRIRSERQRLGFTIQEFANISGHSGRSVSSWEADEALPNIAVLASLAQADIDISFIVCGMPEARASACPADAASQEVRDAIAAFGCLTPRDRRSLLVILLSQELAR